MSTYRQIAEATLRRLAGGDVADDFSIKPEDIYMRTAQIIPHLLRIDYFESYNISPVIDSSYYTSINAKVLKDESTEEYYVVLPGRPVMIAGSGVPVITHQKDRRFQFVYADSGQLSMYEAIGVTQEIDPDKGTLFWIETAQDENCLDSARIYFENLKTCNTLRVDLVLGLDVNCINPDSILNLSPTMEERLMQSLITWFTGQEKEREDNIPNARNEDRV